MRVVSSCVSVIALNDTAGLAASNVVNVARGLSVVSPLSGQYALSLTTRVDIAWYE